MLSEIYVTKIRIPEAIPLSRQTHREFIVFSRHKPNIKSLRELGLMSGEDDWWVRPHVFKELFPDIKLSAYKPVKMTIDLKKVCH